MVPTSWDPLDTLTSDQRDRLHALVDLLQHYNRSVNLVSPDTVADAWERHVLHSLALTARHFPPGCRVVDWGTGGGFPALPLAICFPEVEVHAVDAVRKKIYAVRAMARRLGLANVHAWHGRAEHWPGTAHYSVSRATALLVDLWRWHAAVAEPLPDVGEEAWLPGLLCLKGGDLSAEIDDLHTKTAGLRVDAISLEPLLGRPYFAEKVLLAVQSEKTA